MYQTSIFKWYLRVGVNTDRYDHLASEAVSRIL